jgi:hypothetical protein
MSMISVQPERTSPDGEVAMLKVPDLEVYKVLEIWLASFFPTQELCIRSLTEDRGKAMTEFEPHYREIQKSFDEAFNAYRDSLRQQKADILSKPDKLH